MSGGASERARGWFTNESSEWDDSNRDERTVCSSCNEEILPLARRCATCGCCDECCQGEDE